MGRQKKEGTVLEESLTARRTEWDKRRLLQHKNRVTKDFRAKEDNHV